MISLFLMELRARKRMMSFFAATLAFSRCRSQRAVIVASMSVETNEDEFVDLGINTFVAEPWSLEEYHLAVIDEEFLSSVHLTLSGLENLKVIPEDRRKEVVPTAVDDKYYYAGGSAQWMFSFILSHVKVTILKHLNLLTGNTGSHSRISSNNIDDSKRWFMRAYIARMVLLETIEEVIHFTYELANGLSNPSFYGWIVEMDFISQIRCNLGGALYLKKTDNSCAVQGKYDTNSLEDIQVKLATSTQGNGYLKNVWLLPTKWNQGSYDLVWLQDVMFMDITKRKVHTNEKVLKHYSSDKCRDSFIANQSFKRLADNLEMTYQWNCHRIEIYIYLPILKNVSLLKALQPQVRYQHIEVGLS
jgi:hypothetical protein